MLLLNLLGVFLGACLGYLFIQMRTPSRVGAAVPRAVVPNRRERAAAMLSDMRRAEEAAAAHEAEKERSDSATDDSEWEDDSGDEESGDGDEEYERLESLRLKLVLVVLHGDVKLAAQDVAVLVSSAAVSEIEHVTGSHAPDTPSAPLVRGTVGSSSDTRSQWKEWYAGWNLVGCAKITLKTPDETALKAVFNGAQESGLPCCMLRRSYLDTVRAVGPSSSVAPPPKMAGRKKRGAVPAEAPSPQETARAEPDCDSQPCHDPFVVVALGPAPADALDPFTGYLKLFS